MTTIEKYPTKDWAHELTKQLDVLGALGGGFTKSCFTYDSFSNLYKYIAGDKLVYMKVTFAVKKTGL